MIGSRLRGASRARFRWGRLLVVWAVFMAFAAVLFLERAGISYTGTDLSLGYLDDSQALPISEASFGSTARTLVLLDSSQDGVPQAKEQFDQILLDMGLAHDDVDLAQGGEVPDLDGYDRVVVFMPQLDPMGEGLSRLVGWVEAGGSAMLAMTPVSTGYFQVIAPRLGVSLVSGEYGTVGSIEPTEDFMVGGGQSYEVPDPFESALEVTLRDSARVYATSGGGSPIPLVWANDSGKGRYVVCNIGIYDKVLRGFYAAALSLTGDSCAYPVINSSTFFLDDFPSPVPGGDGSYVKRDYGLSIADFYSRVWWPDVSRLAEAHGIRFTGVMIENYEDDTESEPARQGDTQQFRYYGGMLLSRGGEIGYHGYNHQPLCLGDTDYGDEYSYNTWPSALAIASSLDELASFKDSVLPNARSTVYVPPSNVLSAAGRKVFSTHPEGIRTIASTYFGDGTDYPYVQEFGVSADGIVEEPRIVSGSVWYDSYMRLALVSELNMHFVNTHFMHPDDLLDPDRGAEEGWEHYKEGLSSYLDWLDEAAPRIRKLTASDCAGAIQRYSSVSVEQSSGDDAWTLDLGNFVDEAWLMFRANDGEPGSVDGGELTRLTGDLYLLKATSAHVVIHRTGASR